jgi:acyl-homoserine lactone acylase PvdQ
VPTFHKPTANPNIINPAKGFIVACNNKVAPETAFSGIGSTALTNARAARAYELIKQKIDLGHVVSVKDMQNMQNDVFDKEAKRVLPMLLRVVEKHKRQIVAENSSELETINHLTGILQDWEGDMVGNDKHALIYNVWIEKMLDSLLRKFFPAADQRRIMIDKMLVESHAFLGGMIKKWDSGIELNSEICQAPKNDEPNPCAYVVVSSLLEAHEWIVETVGKNEKNWQWAYVNTHDYYHPVFSDSWLSYLFHKRSNLGVMRSFLC